MITSQTQTQTFALGNWTVGNNFLESNLLLFDMHMGEGCDIYTFPDNAAQQDGAKWLQLQHVGPQCRS